MGHPANLTFEHSLSSTAAPSTPARPQRRPRDLSFIVPQARDDGGSKARSTEISARTSELLQLLELLNSFICYRLSAIGYWRSDLRSSRGEVKINLPGGFEEILFTVGRHFTRNLACFRFIIR